MTAPAHQEGQAPSGHESSPNAIEWTPRLVAAFLAHAAQSLQSHPVSGIPQSEPLGRGGHGFIDSCPGIQTDVAQISASPPLRESLPPVQAALDWLEWLDPNLRRIAWDRANGSPWKAIAHVQGIDRTTAWRRWTCAMVTIAARLNGIADRNNVATS
jgi:hypothetical protein